MTKGYCQCGCGKKTKLAGKNRKEAGWVRGEPISFIRGHQAKFINYRPELERFWEKVRKTDACWLWTASRDTSSYGLFATANRLLKAHRYSYELHKGEIPEDKQIDHLCRVRHCVNPDHLEAVSSVENNHRGKATKLDRRDVRRIREMAVGGELQRVVAGIFGITQTNVSCIVSHKTWKTP